MDSMDPLSSYDSYSYQTYTQLMNNGYPYHVKAEHTNIHQAVSNTIQHLPLPPCMGIYPTPYQTYDKPAVESAKSLTTGGQTGLSDHVEPNKTQPHIPKDNNEDEIDTKENIKLLPQHKKRVPRKRGKTSNYWNKKIEDKNFPFYGCTICNVSYSTIQELDEHVTIHEGRITSYDIRVRNKIKRKEKNKQMKKIKKLGKLLKKEKDSGNNVDKNISQDMEIKPEDGYIGNEKAVEYNSTQNPDDSKQEVSVKENTNDANKEKCDSKSKGNKSKVNEPEDPRLLKLFKCFACQKQFSLSYYLRLHVRSHTDEKPYTCAECGQSFITASKLGRHNKRIHLAIRFQCRICYRFFSRFDILTRHFDKAHAADKIEGEPYDYNAILPYLKELEEQLKEQSEVKDEKLKAENIWSDNAQNINNVEQDEDNKSDVNKNGIDFDVNKNGSESVDTKANLYSMEDSDTKDNIVNKICSVTIGESDVFVKEDKDDGPIEGILVEEVEMDPADDEPDHHDDLGGDSCSDEDYFPSNTWASTPALSPPPAPAADAPSPSPARGTRGARGREGGRGGRAERKEKKDFPMRCEFCDKTIKTHAYYKVHLRTHSGERPFKCYICGRGFITSSKMHRHVLTHPQHHHGEGEKDGNVEAEVKDESGDVKDEIKVEGDEENSKTTKKKKSKKVKTPAVKVPKGELYKKYRKRPHACIYCNKRFLHLDTLDVHKKSHEGQEIVLKCNFCLEVMADEEILKSHEETHTGPRPYLCTICNRSYTKKETLIYHRKSHGGDGGDGAGGAGAGGARHEYICDVCSKSFNAQCKLQRHLVSHKVEKFVLRYECPVCAHMFHTRYHVQMHLNTHQKEGLILEENRNEILAMVLQNARKIPKKSDVSADVSELIPPDERSRVCNICGQVFQHFYYLEEHLKSHGSLLAVSDSAAREQDNKHVCPVCNKGFKLHYYLKLHSFTHSKERPFICQQCGKGFITRGKLKRHLETHTGLKKHQCHVCYKFFTRTSYLRIHVRTIHGTQDYNFSGFINRNPAEHGSV